MKNIPIGTAVKYEEVNRNEIDPDKFTGEGVIEKYSAGCYTITVRDNFFITIHHDFVVPKDPKVRDRILFEEAADKMTEWSKCRNDMMYFYETYWKPTHG